MNLIIDAGNTMVKLAVFDKDTLLSKVKIALADFSAQLKIIFEEFPHIGHSIVSSVGNLGNKDIKIVSLFCKVHVLDHRSLVPFKNSYATPQTLGVDRIALATAAFYDNPNGNTLIVDAGTCVTYDMVNDYGEYLGGAISLGINMRYRALHKQTSKLPELSQKDIIDIIGNSTETGIHSGVINGICTEIDGVIDQYNERFIDLTVILTGGDALFLSKRLKNTIFANSNFLLKGLNYLLEYNKH